MAIIKGDGSNNTLNGGALSDSIFGLGGDDILNGGNDTLDGGLGIDRLSGGTGNDIYVVDNTGDIVKELTNAGIDTVKSSVDWTLGSNVENLILTGTSALNGTGNALKNSITGNVADNTLKGNAGDDTLDGNAGVDTLVGGTGNDLLKIKDFNGDIINGGIGSKDLLQVSGANQHIDLTATDTSITGIEGIKFTGTGNNVLTVSVQSILDLSNDSDTLTVDGDAGDTLSFSEGGWTTDGVLHAGYDVYTLQGATVKVNPLMGIEIPEPVSYTISDAATADRVGSIFTDGVVDVVTIDLGGIQYSQSDLSGGVIDLSGFGSEDILEIAVHDGGIEGSKAHYNKSSSARSMYISQFKFLASTSLTDRVSWQKSASTAKLLSISNGHQLGSIQIVGLPGGLPDSQFVFV